MTITLTAAATQIELDQDLQWVDEFGWASCEQSSERSISGALIIDVAAKTAGRPITLAPPDENAAWMLRPVVEQLQAWEATPALIMTLDFHGREFDVVFNREGGAPIQAKPVLFQRGAASSADLGYNYLVTVRLMTI